MHPLLAAVVRGPNKQQNGGKPRGKLMEICKFDKNQTNSKASGCWKDLLADCSIECIEYQGKLLPNFRNNEGFSIVIIIIELWTTDHVLLIITSKSLQFFHTNYDVWRLKA